VRDPGALSVRRVPAVAALLAASWLSPALAAGARPQETGADRSRFEHERHAGLECTDCHGNGRPTTASVRGWCADCHHVNVTLAECDRCHVTTEITPEPRRALVTFDLSVGEPRTRSLTFDHTVHGGLTCAECHTGGAALRVQKECTSCHVEHHRASADCTACHSEPPVTAHPSELHRELTGCAAAGCHASEGLDFEALQDDRNLCVSCHVAQKEHEPGNPCAACHILGDGGRPEEGWW